MKRLIDFMCQGVLFRKGWSSFPKMKMPGWRAGRGAGGTGMLFSLKYGPGGRNCMQSHT